MRFVTIRGGESAGKPGAGSNRSEPLPVAATASTHTGRKVACGGFEARRRGASQLNHRNGAGAPRTSTTGDLNHRTNNLFTTNV